MTAPRINAAELTLLEPDPTELFKRALFVAASTSLLSMELISMLFEHCSVIDFNANSANDKKVEWVESRHGKSIKELSVLNIWLILLEQTSDESPEWINQFFSDCWSAVETIHEEEPDAAEIMQMYSRTGEVVDTCDEIAMRICYQLQLGTTVIDAPLFFASKLRAAADERAKIFEDALRLSLNAQDELLSIAD